MYGKDSLENDITQKGVVSEEGFIMNMRDLCHEYKGFASCIERGLHSERSMFGKVIGWVDMAYVYTCPRPETHMRSRL